MSCVRACEAHGFGLTPDRFICRPLRDEPVKDLCIVDVYECRFDYGGKVMEVGCGEYHVLPEGSNT